MNPSAEDKKLTVRYSPVQIDWNSARSKLRCQFNRIMGYRRNLGRLLQQEASARQHPFRIEYDLFTDLGRLRLSLTSMRNTSVNVSAVMCLSAVQEVVERVRSPDKVEQAVCCVLRETGISIVHEFQHVSTKEKSDTGVWVEVCSSGGERYAVHHTLKSMQPPTLTHPPVQTFSIQQELRRLKDC